MDFARVYILASIIVLAALTVILIFTGRMKRPEKPSKIALIGLLLVVCGIVFGESRSIGYSLLGAGVVMSMTDIVLQARKARPKEKKKKR